MSHNEIIPGYIVEVVAVVDDKIAVGVDVVDDVQLAFRCANSLTSAEEVVVARFLKSKM